IRHSLLMVPRVLHLILHFDQKAIAILRSEDRVQKNTATVLNYLERIWPNPPLYPAERAQRARAFKIQKWFDDEIGPAARRAAFHELLPHTEYTARRFATGFAAGQQKLYVRAFPAVRAVMALDMHITAAGAEVGRPPAHDG